MGMSMSLLRKITITLLACLVVMSSTRSQEIDSIQLPELGSPSDQYLTPSDEARLGRRFMQRVRETGKVLDDPLITEYIQKLGDKLLKQSQAVGEKFTFFVLDKPEINAFAGPGGYIGIYSGLILATQSESELASVIAHEIAHVTQKHLLRAFDTANRMSGKTAALLLASILVGIAGSADAGLAMATGAQAGAIQEQISFTRSNEEEADTVGIQILEQAGFDPRAMPIFFERMTHASRLYETGIPEILRTHPVTTNRIADALGRAEKYPYRHYPGNLSYYLTREALRVRQFKNTDEAVTHFTSGLKEGRHLNQEAHRYGHALALAANRDFLKARGIIEKLLGENPNQVEYILASADIAESSEDQSKELKILDTYYNLMPHNYPLAVAYIEALTTVRQLDKARKITKQAISLRNNEPSLYRLLSKIEELDHNKTESHRILAEAFIADGDLTAAIQQLEIALNSVSKSDFYLTSSIESRLNRLRDLLEREEEPSNTNQSHRY
jgi:predicted Zn-dependent protease